MRQPVLTQANEKKLLEDAFDRRLRMYGETLDCVMREATECCAVPDFPIAPSKAMVYLDQHITHVRVRRALGCISECCTDAYAELMMRDQSARAFPFSELQKEALCTLNELHLPKLPAEHDMPYVAYVHSAIRQRLKSEILAFIAAPVDSPAKGSLFSLGIALHAVGLHSFGEFLEAGLCYATKVPRSVQECWDLLTVRSALTPRFATYTENHAILMEQFMNEADESCKIKAA